MVSWVGWAEGRLDAEEDLLVFIDLTVLYLSLDISITSHAHTYLTYCLSLSIFITVLSPQRETSARASSSIITIAALIKFPCCNICLERFVVFLSALLELFV